MREIRYRLSHASPQPPALLQDWFAADRGARVHGTNVRFAPGETRCDLVAFCADAKRLAAAMHASPSPGATRWLVEARDAHMVLVDAAWKEPYLADLRSGVRVAHDIFGPTARYGFTILEGVGVFRALVPGDVALDPLWQDLLDLIGRYARATSTEIRVELERIGDLQLPVDASDDDVARAARVAFELGALDTPPLASRAEVARYLGLPPRALETYLAELRR